MLSIGRAPTSMSRSSITRKRGSDCVQSNYATSPGARTVKREDGTHLLTACTTCSKLRTGPTWHWIRRTYVACAFHAIADTTHRRSRIRPMATWAGNHDYMQCQDSEIKQGGGYGQVFSASFAQTRWRRRSHFYGAKTPKVAPTLRVFQSVFAPAAPPGIVPGASWATERPF